MTTETEEAGTPSHAARPRRANRRLNGMGKTAGLPDPPTRGKLTRTLALLDAALRVWETDQPQRASVWRRNRR